MSLRHPLLALVVLGLLGPASAAADRLTVRGTKAFKSVTPNSPAQFGSEYVTFKGFVYFVANDDVHGNELWRTDGTDAGTVLVADLYPGLPSTDSNPHRFTVVGDRLFFNAYNATTGSSETVYVIDASAPTTVKQLTARRADNNNPVTAIGTIFGAPNGRLVISRLLGELSNCCYAAYALVPGATELAKISAGADDVAINNLFSPSATAGGWTYYPRSNVNVSPGEGAELWRTNGLITEPVKDINPPTGAGQPNPGSSPSGFVATSDRVYFTADDGVHGRELWVTNPVNKADTHLVHEHVPGTASVSIDDPAAVANGDVLYYVPANDPVTGPEVWRTDGTETGTRVVRDVTPGTGGYSGPKLFALGGGIGFLRGSSVFASTDGSDAATADLAETGGDGYGPNSPTLIGNRAYFVGGASPFGQAIWRTDGTTAGTLPVSAGGFDGTSAASGSVSAQTLAVLGDRLVFFGRDPETNSTGLVKLYVIDTTASDDLRTATTAPAITGKPTVGERLDVSQGSWAGRTTSYRYQWLRNGQPIAEATNAYYFAAAGDVGQSISARVTSIGIGAPREATADAAGVTVAARTASGSGTGSAGTKGPPAPPVVAVLKQGALPGTPRVGKTLRPTLPKFESGVTLSYAWKAGGKPIKKKTKPFLKLTKAQKGKTITLVITASKPGFRPVTVTLGPTPKVKAAKR